MHRLKTGSKVLFCLFLLVVFSCGGTQEVVRPSKSWQLHIVRKGETLYSISRRYGTTVETLRKANKIQDPHKLRAGQRIWVPKRSRKYRPPDQKKTTPIPDDSQGKKLYGVQLIWPIKGKISSRFGVLSNRIHDGIDIVGRKGTAIRAAEKGEVIFSGWGPGGYGRMIILKHSKRVLTVYAHNDANLVGKNRKVKKGEMIAKVGKSGKATGNHLHFEVRIDRKPRDPLKFLPRRK